MAEIQIERKERPVWPWVIGAILLALLVLWLVGGFWTREQQVAEGPVAGALDPRDEAPAEVRGYANWLEEHRDRVEPARVHTYAADGIRELADALAALADRGEGTQEVIQTHLDRMRELAGSIGNQTSSVDHAALTRQAFTTGVEAFERLADRQYVQATNNVGELRDGAQALNPQQPLTDQVADVKEFFIRAGLALQRMAS